MMSTGCAPICAQNGDGHLFVTSAEMGDNEAGRNGARNATPALDPPSACDYRKEGPR